MFRGSALRFVSLGVVALLISSCSTAHSPKWAAFSSQNPGTGIVVIGMSIERYNPIFSIESSEAFSQVKLDWTRWSSQSEPPSPLLQREHFYALITGCFVGNFNPNVDYSETCDLTKWRYRVLEVKAGDYRLTGISSSTGYRQRDADVKASDQMTIHVGAGEIVYVGDFRLNVLSIPASVFALDHDEYAAQQALTKYPNIHGDLIYRAPKKVAENSN